MKAVFWGVNLLPSQTTGALITNTYSIAQLLGGSHSADNTGPGLVWPPVSCPFLGKFLPEWRAGACSNRETSITSSRQIVWSEQWVKSWRFYFIMFFWNARVLRGMRDHIKYLRICYMRALDLIHVIRSFCRQSQLLSFGQLEAEIKEIFWFFTYQWFFKIF